MASSLPLMVHLAGRSVLVVGGGPVATAKAVVLAGLGARVTMVAPWFCPAALALAEVQRLERRYRPADLSGRWLVVAAVDDETVSAAVAADAEAARVFCNAADRPAYCSATLMATHRDEELTVAVSTDGASPAAASWLRDRLVEALGGGGGPLVRFAADARRRLRHTRRSEGVAWAALFEQVMHADKAEAERAVNAFVEEVKAAQDRDLSEAILPAVRRSNGPDSGPRDADRPAMRGVSGRARRIGHGVGSVALVGAGPGDPRLLTVAAVEALTAADVVVHDALVGDGVLAMVPAGVELIDVGKRPGRPVPQELIGSLLVELARDRLRVVRLKGGDPFVFGRGGEEALVLQEAGVAFEVIPGISSALAAPARAGIPVTHRGAAASFSVVTGHRAAELAAVDWSALARVGGTIVVLMGVTQRGPIAEALQSGGLGADTPVAVIERAGQDTERVIRTVLGDLGATAVSAPAVLVIGAVAALDLRSVVSMASPAKGEQVRAQE